STTGGARTAGASWYAWNPACRVARLTWRHERGATGTENVRDHRRGPNGGRGGGGRARARFRRGGGVPGDGAQPVARPRGALPGVRSVPRDGHPEDARDRGRDRG